jgi:predicted dehydrogenase
VKVLVVGSGSIGQRHLRNLRALGVDDLLAVEPSSGPAAAAAALGATVMASLPDALAKAPDAVIVCTPPHLHLEGARAALEAGAHVLVEKPLAASLDGVDDVLALAERRNRTLAVGYNWRFHAVSREVKRLLDAGTIGRPLLLRVEVGQYLPDWRPQQDYRAGYNARAAHGGGILLDATHELDYAWWLCGDIKGVSAMIEKLSDLEIDVEDVALLQLRFASGALGHAHLDTLQRAYARGGKLVGTEGTLVWELMEGLRVYSTARGAWETRPMVTDPNDMYREEVRQFLDCVQHGVEPSASGRDGRRALEIVQAARTAAREGREVPV